MAAESSKDSSGVVRKFCRACSDFRHWFKAQAAVEGEKKTAEPKKDEESAEKVVTAEENHLRKNCPLDKDELGRATWGLLHSMAAYYPDDPNPRQKEDMKSFMGILGRNYPCDWCAEGLRKDLEDTPPAVSSRQEFSRWMCQLHNKVNRKMGKKEFDCSLVEERWKDGWKDGSCDS